MIDNFDQINKLLEFDSEDDFYFCQIMKRKKEHPEIGSNSIVIKTYYIKSHQQLEDLREEMTALAEVLDARVYINLNRRSFEKIAFHTMIKISNIMMNKDWNSVKQAYDSVCGANHNEKNKKWIIDIDSKADDLYEYYKVIERAEPILEFAKVLAIVNTKNGYHLITRPFDCREFSIVFPLVDIQKNNPTILYVK